MHERRARSQYGFCKSSAYLKKSYYLRGTELPLPCVAVWKGNLARREKKGPCTPGHPRSVTVPALYFRPSIRRASSFDIIESAGAYTDITNASMSCCMSSTVAAFLTTSTASPPRPTKSGNTSKPEPLIVRTLRSTLNAPDPAHVAHGPVWALSVLACFIVLLGPRLCTDIQLTRIVSALLTLAIRSKKSSVRALGCLLWRCITWSYMRPLLRSEHDAEQDDEGADVQDQDIMLARENFWKLVRSVVDMGVGVSTVAALITDEYDDEDRLRKAIELIPSFHLIRVCSPQNTAGCRA